MAHRTLVPEAPIYEYDYLVLGEVEVGFAWHAGRMTYPAANSVLTHGTCRAKLSRPISARTDPRHALRPLRSRERVYPGHTLLDATRGGRLGEVEVRHLEVRVSLPKHQ
jgi:hypothetical protein